LADLLESVADGGQLIAELGLAFLFIVQFLRGMSDHAFRGLSIFVSEL
jgi:hypothetical protein